jgi:hypothetical protein
MDCPGVEPDPRGQFGKTRPCHIDRNNINYLKPEVEEGEERRRRETVQGGGGVKE